MKFTKSPKPITKALDKPVSFVEQLQKIERPTFTDSLKFPDDITRIQAREISKLMGCYTALHAFILAEMSKLNARKLAAMSASHRRKSEIYRLGVGSGRRRYDTENLIKGDSQMSQLSVAEHSIDIELGFAKNYAEIYERYVSTLSRELTRRMGEMGMSKRL